MLKEIQKRSERRSRTFKNVQKFWERRSRLLKDIKNVKELKFWLTGILDKIELNLKLNNLFCLTFFIGSGRSKASNWLL